MADLTALGATHETRLTGAVRREVVVMHVALTTDRINTVDHLIHAASTEGGHIEHLRVATLEQARTVSGRNNANLGCELAQVCWTTAIHADALVQDAVTHDLLCELAQCAADEIAIMIGEFFADSGLDRSFRDLTLHLVSDRHRLFDTVGSDCGNSFVDLVGRLGGHGVFHLWLCAEGLDELMLQLNRLADPCL